MREVKFEVLVEGGETSTLEILSFVDKYFVDFKHMSESPERRHYDFFLVRLKEAKRIDLILDEALQEFSLFEGDGLGVVSVVAHLEIPIKNIVHSFLDVAIRFIQKRGVELATDSLSTYFELECLLLVPSIIIDEKLTELTLKE